MKLTSLLFLSTIALAAVKAQDSSTGAAPTDASTPPSTPTPSSPADVPPPPPAGPPSSPPSDSTDAAAAAFDTAAASSTPDPFAPSTESTYTPTTTQPSEWVWSNQWAWKNWPSQDGSVWHADDWFKSNNWVWGWWHSSNGWHEGWWPSNWQTWTAPLVSNQWFKFPFFPHKSYGPSAPHPPSPPQWTGSGWSSWGTWGNWGSWPSFWRPSSGTAWPSSFGGHQWDDIWDRLRDNYWGAGLRSRSRSGSPPPTWSSQPIWRNQQWPTSTTGSWVLDDETHQWSWTDGATYPPGGSPYSASASSSWFTTSSVQPAPAAQPAEPATGQTSAPPPPPPPPSPPAPSS